MRSAHTSWQLAHRVPRITCDDVGHKQPLHRFWLTLEQRCTVSNIALATSCSCGRCSHDLCPASRCHMGLSVCQSSKSVALSSYSTAKSFARMLAAAPAAAATTHQSSTVQQSEYAQRQIAADVVDFAAGQAGAPAHTATTAAATSNLTYQQHPLLLCAAFSAPTAAAAGGTGSCRPPGWAWRRPAAAAVSHAQVTSSTLDVLPLTHSRSCSCATLITCCCCCCHTGMVLKQGMPPSVLPCQTS
jgi:hypothetical protein